MVSRTPKNTAQSDDFEIPSIFEHFEGARSSQPKAKQSNEPDVAALMSRIDGLTSTVETLRQDNLRLTQAPIYNVLPPAQNQPAQGSQLPDPLEDPDSFANTLTARILETVGSQLAERDNAANYAADLDNKAATMWTDFQKQYPSWSSYEDRVGYVTNLVCNDAESKGLDLNRYMFNNRDQFFKDVNAKMVEVFGAPEDDDGSNSPSETATSGDDGASRTAATFPGSGSPMAFERPTSGPKPGDMIKDIQDLQRKSGFY